MNSSITIMTFIKKVSRRIKKQRLVPHLLLGLMVSLCLCILLLFVSLVVVVPYTFEKCLWIVGVGVIISIVYSLVTTPKKKEVALLVDQTGLDERVSTALMLMEVESPVSILQREDTLRHIEGYNIKKNFPIRVPLKRVAINVLLCVLCGISFMIPTPAKQAEKSIRGFDKQKEEIIKEIEEAEKDLSKEEKVSQLEKKAILELLSKTAQEIPKAENEDDIEKAMERLDKKLEKKSDEIKEPEAKKSLDKMKDRLTKEFKDKIQKKAKKDLENLSDLLKKNELTKELGEQLAEDKDKSGLTEEEQEQKLLETLEELEKQLSQLSEAEKEALASALSQAANSVGNQQLAQSLGNASSQVMQGSMNVKALQAAMQNLKNSASSSSNSGSNSSGSQGSGENNSQGNGQGKGQGNGAGGNQGGGQGQGIGGGWNMGSNIGHEKQNEGTIKTPGENITSHEEQLSGKVNENGEMKQGEVEYGINIAGEKIDYHSVIGNYTDEALDKVENAPVPDQMKDVVKDYFEAINQ